MPDYTDYDYTPIRYSKNDIKPSEQPIIINYEEMSKAELIDRLVNVEKERSEYARECNKLSARIKQLETLVAKLEDRNLYYDMDERDKREKELSDSLQQKQTEINIKNKEINNLKNKNTSLKNQINHITKSNNNNDNSDSYSKYLDYCYKNGCCPCESEY